jgi:hypothetical protein
MTCRQQDRNYIVPQKTKGAGSLQRPSDYRRAAIAWQPSTNCAPPRELREPTRALYR